MIYETDQVLFPILVTAPTIEPVTLDEAKEHLRVTSTDEDGYISSLITAARSICEAEQDRTYITTTLRVTIDSFTGRTILKMPRPPLITVSSITYLDSAGATQTLSSSMYTVDVRATPGRVLPSYANVWPDTRMHPGAINIQYTAGYGTSSNSVPMSIKKAILLLTAHLFENREPVGNIVNPIPYTVSALLDVERWSLKHG